MRRKAIRRSVDHVDSHRQLMRDGDRRFGPCFGVLFALGFIVVLTFRLWIGEVEVSSTREVDTTESFGTDKKTHHTHTWLSKPASPHTSRWIQCF